MGPSFAAWRFSEGFLVTLPAAAVAPSSPSFPRWVIAGFVLAGVLIVSGLAGFVYTRSRP